MSSPLCKLDKLFDFHAHVLIFIIVFIVLGPGNGQWVSSLAVGSTLYQHFYLMDWAEIRKEVGHVLTNFSK